MVIAAAAVAPTNAVAADRLSPPITGFTATGVFSDVTTGPDGRLWIAEPQPTTDLTSSVGNLFSVSTDGNVKLHFPTGWTNKSGGLVEGMVPSHIATGADGTLWYSGDTDRIGQSDTDGSNFDFQLDPQGVDAGGQIGELAPGADGSIWFTEANLSRIGEVTADEGIVSYPVGVTPGRITTGPDHNVWFTVPSTGKVGRLTPDGAVTIFDLPPLPEGDTLSAITAGPDGNIWMASSEVFLKVATDGSVQGKYNLTGYTALTHITDLAPGPDGNVWFTEQYPHAIGRVYPDGTFSTDFTRTFGGAAPTAITKGPNADLYYVGSADQGPAVVNNVLGRIVPTTGPHGSVHPIIAATDTTATVITDENPEGADTAVHFDWGLTNTYGSSTPDQTVAAGGVASVSATISGLRSGTVYHFRSTQTNASGTAQSGDYTFKTTGSATGPSFVGAPTIPTQTKHATANDVGGALAVQVTKVKLTPSGVTRVPLKCLASSPCNATVVVTGTIGKKKSVVFAHKTTVVKSGATAKLGLRLSKAAAKAVRKAGKKGLSALVTVTVNGVKQRYRLKITR